MGERLIYEIDVYDSDKLLLYYFLLDNFCSVICCSHITELSSNIAAYLCSMIIETMVYKNSLQMDLLFQNLISGSPCFFMDIIYLHEPPSEENQSEEIYQELCDLDTRGFSHVFDVSH